MLLEQSGIPVSGPCLLQNQEQILSFQLACSYVHMTTCANSLLCVACSPSLLS